MHACMQEHKWQLSQGLAGMLCRTSFGPGSTLARLWYHKATPFTFRRCYRDCMHERTGLNM